MTDRDRFPLTVRRSSWRRFSDRNPHLMVIFRHGIPPAEKKDA